MLAPEPYAFCFHNMEMFFLVLFMPETSKWTRTVERTMGATPSSTPYSCWETVLPPTQSDFEVKAATSLLSPQLGEYSSNRCHLR